MILNLRDDKILKRASDIKISDFTVLTGENGSEKTQLLQFIRDNFLVFDYINNEEQVIEQFPLKTDDGKPILEVIYSHPGIRNDLYFVEQQPLIDRVKQQWNELQHIADAAHSIRHKFFGNKTLELSDLNSALDNLVERVTNMGSMGRPSAKKISDYQLDQVKKLAESSGKYIGDLNLIDFIIFYQIPLNLFSAALDLLFHQFYLKQKHYKQLIENVTPPVDIFNEILEKASFKYKAIYSESTDEEQPGTVKLIDRQNYMEVDFQSLSSGETTILALIFVLYNSSNKGHFPEVILFDEPDAHLHPSLTQIFLDVVQEVLVKEHNVKVILTTHSPSTVALAPDDSIYCMDRNLGRPVKQNKKAAINALSSGLTSLTIEESSLGISYNIKKANKHILFTEGITDKIILETAWEKLYPDKEMNFYIQDCFGAGFLGKLFLTGNDSPDGIFHQSRKLKMIALFDFDNAGYSNWNQKDFSRILEENPRKGLTKYNNKNGFLLLLPVPPIEAISKHVIISDNNTYEGNSRLTIEGLLFDCEELKDHFRGVPISGGSTAFEFIGNKRDFALKLSELNPSVFVHFKPLFEQIEVLLSESLS